MSDTIQNTLDEIKAIANDMPYANVSPMVFNDNTIIIKITPKENYKIYRATGRIVVRSVKELENLKKDIAVSVVTTEEEQNSNTSESTEV